MPFASVLRSRRAPLGLAAMAAALAMAAGAADAQTAAATPEPEPASPESVTPTPATPAPTPPGRVTRPAAPDPKAAQRVEITGATDPNTERRRSTAAKIIIGREEIERMGDSTLGEVLKRLPGVSIGGAPGRGGPPRMRGMGAGYTAILIDGQRMPMGFSLDSIAPEQIERIEILRAPTAELGARAVAGIINVVMRDDFRRKANELRFGGGLEDGRRAQGGGSWNYSGQNEALGYSFSSSTLTTHQADESLGHVLGTDAQGNTTLEQFSHSQSESKRANLFLNGRLQFRLGPGHTLDLQPFANFSRGRSHGSSTLDQTIGQVSASQPEPYALADYRTESDNATGRIGGTWARTMADGGRLQVRFGGRLAQSNSLTQRNEYASNHVVDGAAGGAVDRVADRVIDRVVYRVADRVAVGPASRFPDPNPRPGCGARQAAASTCR